MAAADKPPVGLGTSGRGLWRTVTAGYALREDERQALAAAARTLDELARIEAALKDAPVVVSGSTGQDRPNPLFAEARAHRLALRQLLVSVGLTDPDVDRLAGAARAAAGRSLARQRWGTRGTA